MAKIRLKSDNINPFEGLISIFNQFDRFFSKILEYSNKSVFLHRIVTRVTVTDVTKKRMGHEILRQGKGNGGAPKD